MEALLSIYETSMYEKAALQCFIKSMNIKRHKLSDDVLRDLN